jgi:uncharacterized membrane protein
MVSAAAEGVTLAVHIAAGVVALLAGAVAVSSEKGGRRHVTAGKVYVGAMAVVVLTVLPLFVIEPGTFARRFLLLVAVFSGYFVFSGYRVLGRKSATADGEPVDQYAAGLVSVACLGLGAWGVLTVLGGHTFGLVMAVFGALGLSFGVADLRAFRRGRGGGSWLSSHVARMIGGYIATVTAVSAVNLAGVVPAVVSWLWPTAVGVALVWYVERAYVGTGPLARVRPPRRRGRGDRGE